MAKTITVPDAPLGDGYASEAARCRDLHRQLQVLWMEWHDGGLPQVTRSLAKREWEALWQPAYESFLRMAWSWQNGSYVAATVHDAEEAGRLEFARRHLRANVPA